jgi:hypothetical protein
MPPFDARNSATTTPTSARPVPSRAPVRMNGTLAGRTTVRNRIQPDAPKLWAMSWNRASAAWTPAIVLTTTTKIASRNTTKILACSPMPRIRMISGTSATVGVE